MNHVFIVGAQRSGSTYLYHLLDGHPQITFAKPVRPEPKHFLNDESYAKGREYYESKYFDRGMEKVRCFGEKSTSYIESTLVAQRIHDFYPDARILMILRDPVLRAWSNYRFSAQHGLEPLDFEAALAAEPERLRDAAFTTSVNPYAYQQRGHYIDYIERYLKVFSPAQLGILIFEETVGKIDAIQDLYRWLGVDDAVVPASLGEIVNPGSQQVEVSPATLRDLAGRYEDSLARLEGHLHRRVDCWRRNWEML